MTQVSIDHQVNPRFVPDDVPLWLGNARDSAIIYDATADELTLQTSNASAVLTDRIRVEAGTSTPFVELAAGRFRLLDAAADPAAAGEITRNGADLKVYSGGTVLSLSNMGTLSNLVEDTTPQLGGDLASNGNGIIMADNDKLLLGDVTAESSLYFDGVDTILNLREGGSGDLMIALAGSFPSPDPASVHIWSGSAGAITAHAQSRLVVENSGAVALSLLAPNANNKFINFGEPANDSQGRIIYYGSASSPANTFGISIANAERLRYSAASFAFQEATNISTTVGDLTLNPTGDVDLNSNNLLNVGAAGNDLGANSWAMASANSGGGNTISVDNTSDTANSTARLTLQVGGSSAGDPFISMNESGGHELSIGLDTSASRFAMSASGALGTNDIMRITDATPPVITYNTTNPTGTFDYVCEGCGEHRGADFECCGRVTWHDDQLAVYQFMNGTPGSYDHMVKLGIMEYDSDHDPSTPAVPW